MDKARKLSTSVLASHGLGSTLLNMAIGIVCAIICASTTVREGLELLFVLPMAFVITRGMFSRAYSYWKDNVALAIIFASIYVRYLATPVLMTLSHSSLSTVYPSVSSYRMALLIQVFELFATIMVIDLVWTRHLKKKAQTPQPVDIPKETATDFRLSLFGFLFVAALIMLVVARGHISNVFSHYSTWWYISEETSDLMSYDLMAIDVAKSVIAITIISVLARAYHKSGSKFMRGIYFLLALAIGLFITMFYQYTLRTALAQAILSSMIMLIAFFPQKKKTLLIVFGIGGMAFLMYTFATGSMQYEIGGSNNNMLEKMARMGELYVSGPSMVAITQERYGWVRENMTIATYFSDIINTTHIFGLFPFLRGITGLVAGVPTSNQLFVDSLGGLTYILPNYSFWTYYATSVFGWIMEIVSIIVTVKLICFIDVKKSKFNDGGYTYAMAYTETLLGQVIFVNNSFLLWHAFTNMPFWLLVFCYINWLGNRVKIK